MPAANANIPNKVGDPATWVDRYGDALMRYAVQRSPRREVAEDLVQEAFLSAYRHRHKFDGRSEFGTWLTTILRHKIADYYRSTKSSATTVVEGETDDAAPIFNPRGHWIDPPTKWHAAPDAIAESVEFWEIFHTCFSGLPAHLAHAFELREISAASMDDAADRAGITSKNLAVRLHRARLLLRQCLEKKWFRSGVGTLP